MEISSRVELPRACTAKARDEHTWKFKLSAVDARERRPRIRDHGALLIFCRAGARHNGASSLYFSTNELLHAKKRRKEVREQKREAKLVPQLEEQNIAYVRRRT